MDIKFSRMQISLINNGKLVGLNKEQNLYKNKKVAVPAKETFQYILECAKKGNEMAAVQLDEWHRCCTPQNPNEEQVIRLINKGVNEIFE